MSKICSATAVMTLFLMFSVRQPVVVTEQLVEPEVVGIKKERLEEELTGYSVLDHQTAPNSSCTY